MVQKVKLLNVTEVAELLGMSVSNVYNLIHSRGTGFPVIKLGREYRFNEEAIIKWLLEKQEEK